MIEAGLIGALGLAGAIVAFAFWQAIRASTATDARIAAIAARAKSEIACEARGYAIAERDRVIDALENDNRRLRAGLAAASTALPAPSPGATVKDSADAIRDALGGLRDLAGAGARGVSEVPIVPGSPALKDR